MATKAKPSLFERARQAKPRTETYRIPLIDRTEADRVWTDLTNAQQRAKQAEIFGDADAQKSAQADLKAASAKYAEAFADVTFRGLPAVDMDALANEYPDPVEGEDTDGHVPFIYRLAAASCVGDGSDTTAEQWQELCERDWPVAEATEFRQAVLDANQQPYSAGLGKG